MKNKSSKTRGSNFSSAFHLAYRMVLFRGFK